MDKNFLDMIKLFVYASTGNDTNLPCDFDFEKVMKYAEDQGVWHLVCYAAEQIHKQGKVQINKDLLEISKMQMIMVCLHNSQKLDFSHKIIAEFNKNNIKNCVIKGETLSNLYFKPECRVSGDIDIYIGNEDDKKACKILNNFGYKIEPKSEDANHYSCVHPTYGELELHVTLYYKIIQETWFQNIKLIEEDFTDYVHYSTLGYTDGCINIALHAINHFLSSGFGIRHIMDFLLYLDKFYDKIDMDRFTSVMKQLKYYHFIEVMIGIGKIHFGMDCKIDALYTKDEAEKVLYEVYRGGIFGHKIKDAKTFEIYTSMKIAQTGKQSAETYMRNWRRKNVLKALSFAPSKMYKHYPYAQKNKLLLPVAWCNHIGYIFKTAFTRRKIVADVIKYKTPEKNEEIERKIELFKELDMI